MLLNSNIMSGSGNNNPKVPQVVAVEPAASSQAEPAGGSTEAYYEWVESDTANAGNDYHWIYSNKREDHFFHTCEAVDTDGTKKCRSKAIPEAFQKFPEFKRGHGCAAIVDTALCTAEAQCLSQHVNCSECKNPHATNCETILPGQDCAPRLNTDYNSNMGAEGQHGCGVGPADEVTCSATASCHSNSVTCEAQTITCTPPSTSTNLLLGMLQPRSGTQQFDRVKDWCLKLQEPHGFTEPHQGSQQVIQVQVCADNDNAMLWTLEESAPAEESPTTASHTSK